jgi:hypothetical protein
MILNITFSFENNAYNVYVVWGFGAVYILGRCQRFGETYCLHLQYINIITAINTVCCLCSCCRDMTVTLCRILIGFFLPKMSLVNESD